MSAPVVSSPFAQDTAQPLPSWFVEADPAQHNRVAVASSVRQYVEHEHLYLVGQKSSVIYQVLEGVVGVYTLLADGRRQITNFVYPGDIVGLDCASWHYDSAQALCPVTVRSFALNAIDRLLTEESGFLQALLRGVTAELVDTRERMVWLGQMSAAERVAGFVLQMSEQHPLAGSEGRRVWLPMMRGDIADYLGLKVETVSRQFTRLRVARIIKLASLREIEILDRDRLAELALRPSILPGESYSNPQPVTIAHQDPEPIRSVA